MRSKNLCLEMKVASELRRLLAYALVYGVVVAKLQYHSVISSLALPLSLFLWKGFASKLFYFLKKCILILQQSPQCVRIQYFEATTREAVFEPGCRCQWRRGRQFHFFYFQPSLGQSAARLCAISEEKEEEKEEVMPIAESLSSAVLHPLTN